MKKIGLHFSIAIMLFGCSAGTEITGSWQSENASSKKMNKILVMAFTSDTTLRQTLEEQLTAELQEHGFHGIQSIEVFPRTLIQDNSPDKEAVLNNIKSSGAEAILTVAIIEEKTDTRYIAQSGTFTPISQFTYYGGFGGYFNTWYPIVQSPSYYTDDKSYFIETNFYDAGTEEILWAAQSKANDSNGLPDFPKEKEYEKQFAKQKDFASVVIGRMEKDGVLHRDEAITKAK